DGLVFTPTLNASGAGAIQVVTDDLGHNPSGNLTDTDSLAITITAVNDPPVNSVPPTQTTNEDTTLTFSSGNGNAITISDVESATAQVQLTATNGVLTLGSLAGLSFTVNDGTADATMTFSGNITAINTALNGLVYAPNLNVNGPQTVTIVTNDQGNTGAGGVQSDTDPITVNVTAVNDAPVNTVPAGVQNMNQDSVLTFTGATQISVADVDAGGNSIQVQLTATNGTITLSGTTGLSFSVGNGTANTTMTFTGTIAAINTALNNLQFASSAGFFSGPNATLQIVTDDLGFTGTPGAMQDSDTIQIFVQQVNQKPVNSVPGTQTINEDTTLTFTGGNAISTSDIDAGSDPGVEITLSVTSGSLHLIPTAGVTINNNDTATVNAFGTIANLNTALNGLAYTPVLNFNGSATLTFTTNDHGATGPGGAQSDTDPITINITAVNDAPVLVNPAAVAPAEDAQFSFTAANTISVTDVDSGAGTNFVATLSVSNGTINVTGAGVTNNNTNNVTITGTV
ncbi:MAG TPA: hypothetical protein VN181_12295, partial [Thermoanaerobaculia bacterium]|nr:hypothetical protein [Thermoanaerobaculia bacterium]